MNINSRKYFVELLWCKGWFINFMAPLFRWRTDKANDLQLESDPRVAGSVVIGSGTNANYCRGVFIFKDLDASQEATPHNWVKPFMNSRVVVFFVASSSNKKSTTKCQPKSFVVVAIKKEKRQPGMFSFRISTKKLADIWCLVLVFSFRLMHFSFPLT